MFVGTIKKGISIKGYLDKGLVEPHNILARHNDLVKEMKKRGMKHNSGMMYVNYEGENKGKVNILKNHMELRKRCINCRKLQHNIIK